MSCEGCGAPPRAHDQSCRYCGRERQGAEPPSRHFSSFAEMQQHYGQLRAGTANNDCNRLYHIGSGWHNPREIFGDI